MNKCAQAGIITTVLIILVVLVAVIAVWSVISNIVTKSGSEIDINPILLGAEIESFETYEGELTTKVVIKRGAWLGVNCVIFPGVTIGKNSVVAAGSIVKKDVPDYTVVAGAPAKIIRKINEY